MVSFFFFFFSLMHYPGIDLTIFLNYENRDMILDSESVSNGQSIQTQAIQLATSSCTLQEGCGEMW